MSVYDQIAVLSKELARIRSLVESNADATIITTKYTRDNVTATVNAALIALMPLTSLQDWPGLAAMYTEGGKSQKMNGLNEMKLYSSATSGNSVFCGGPGPLTVESAYIEPVWGTAALFPHLVRAKMAFFNGQIPLVRPSVYVPILRTGLNMCGGRAIIVFYPPPWPAYLETAMLAYLIGTGSTTIHAIIPPARQQQLIAIAPDTPIVNIPGYFFLYKVFLFIFFFRDVSRPVFNPGSMFGSYSDRIRVDAGAVESHPRPACLPVCACRSQFRGSDLDVIGRYIACYKRTGSRRDTRWHHPDRIQAGFINTCNQTQ